MRWREQKVTRSIRIHPGLPRRDCGGGGEREKGGEVRGNPRYRGCYGDKRGSPAQPYSGGGSVRRLDENGSFGVIVLLCRAPLSLALTANPENKRTSAETSNAPNKSEAALIFYSRHRLSRSCVAISCSSATDRCCVSSSSLTRKRKEGSFQTFLLLLVFNFPRARNLLCSSLISAWWARPSNWLRCCGAPGAVSASSAP